MSQRAYVGVDLGRKFHEVQVTSSFRIGRGRAGLAALRQGVIAVVGAEAEAVYTIEATQNFWQELVHPLRRAGAHVYLVSPSKSTALRTSYRRHTKTDAIDAAATSRLPTVDPALHPAVAGRQDPAPLLGPGAGASRLRGRTPRDTPVGQARGGAPPRVGTRGGS